MSKTELYLSKIIKYGLYAILLTPLAFWSQALYGFLTPKFILFQILVEIVFGAWLILLLRKRGFTQIKADLRGNYIILVLVLFIAVSFISAIFGVDFSRSFWGIGPRMTGLFAELHFLAWFLVLISYLKNDKEKWNNYLNFSFFVSIIVALSLFFQSGGVFNNPTFVAPYLLFHFFWGLYQLLKNKEALYKLIFGISTAFLLFSVFFIGIRGAAIGFLVGLIFLILALIFSNILNRRFRIAMVIILLVSIAGISGIWYLRETDFVKNIGFLERLTSVTLTSTTVQTRLLAWQVVLGGFKDKSILGTGSENFNFLFNAHYNPRFLKFGGGGFGETWFDKPHNAFLEILSETGIVGSLAYVFIWAVVSLALFRLFKKGEKFLSLILASAFITYFGAVFFSFDSFGSWFGLYLFLAFLASHSNTNLPARNAFSIADAGGQIYPKKLFVVFACISILGLLGVNLSIWRANITDADALRTFPRDTEQGINLFKKSLNYFTPYKAEYQFDLLASVIGAMQKNIPLPDIENTINFALDEANKALNAHPENAAYYSDMAKLYGILGGMGRDPAILAQSEEFGKKALELSPKRQETMFYLAQTALLRGDAKLAIEWTKQAVQVDPAIKQSHWYLGRLYIASGKNEEGISEIKKALELGYRPQNQNEKDFIQNFGL